MTDVNLQEIHDKLLEVALEAGRMITAANLNSITTGTKINCMLPSLYLPYLAAAAPPSFKRVGYQSPGVHAVDISQVYTYLTMETVISR